MITGKRIFVLIRLLLSESSPLIHVGMGRDQKNSKYFPEEIEWKSPILKSNIASIYQSLAMSGRGMILVEPDLMRSTVEILQFISWGNGAGYYPFILAYPNLGIR